MKLNLNSDSGIMGVLAKITDIMLLQLMFILTSLPIFTIGAGLSALFATTRKLKHDSVTSTIRTYFVQFKANFKQGTILWIMFLLAGGLLYFDISYYTVQERTALNTVMLAVSYILAIVVYLIAVYAFPLAAWFENSVKAQLKNALLMSVSHFLTTLLVTVVYIVFVIMAIAVTPLFVFVGFSGAIYISGWLIARVLSKHAAGLEPETDDTEMQRR